MATFHFSSFQRPSPGRLADLRQRAHMQTKSTPHPAPPTFLFNVRAARTPGDRFLIPTHHDRSLTLSLIAAYLMASSSRSARLCASRSSSRASSPCRTWFSSWTDRTEEDMAPAARRNQKWRSDRKKGRGDDPEEKRTLTAVVEILCNDLSHARWQTRRGGVR